MYNINILNSNHRLQKVFPYDLVYNPTSFEFASEEEESRLLLSETKDHLHQLQDGCQQKLSQTCSKGDISGELARKGRSLYLFR